MVSVERYVDVKYFSQSRFFTVDLPDGELKDLEGITRNFMDDMQAEYGYNLPPGYAPVEVVNLRVVAKGEIIKPNLPEIEEAGSLEDARKPNRQVWFKGHDFLEADIYERGKLPPGAEFDGPAVIEQPDTTTVMPPGTHCSVDKYGNLVINVDQ
jgi:N-methylhydantoinase A